MKKTFYVLVACLFLHAPPLSARKTPYLGRQSVNFDVFPVLTNAKRNLSNIFTTIYPYEQFEKFRLLETMSINYTREARTEDGFFRGSWRYGLRFNFRMHENTDPYVNDSSDYEVYYSKLRYRVGFSIGHSWEYELINKKLFLTYGVDVIGEYSRFQYYQVKYSDFMQNNYYYNFKYHWVTAALSPEVALRYDITSYLSIELGFSLPIRWQKGWDYTRIWVGSPIVPGSEISNQEDVQANIVQVYFRPLLKFYYFF